ncbi:transporter substrate-binding domain-containing protein [Flavobacterium sp. TMP13]|uniref:transporter substrate-binding domain-containing protein n=1 Tax=Flavobacterium sp. TMP13 TaxID=3425950 RepID=UPI003D77C158
MIFKTNFFFIIFLFFTSLNFYSQKNDTLISTTVQRELKVGFAGSEPFVIKHGESWNGISVEIWDLLVKENNIDYTIIPYVNVSQAINDLQKGTLDILVGPVSITSERAELINFSQPYFQSSLSILSRVDAPTIFDRVAPLFTIELLYALFIFLFILGCVGTLLWLAEREASPEQFPHEPVRGIANGMWCAIVTMSTTGYGDIAPVTLMGRIVAGSWMIVSILFATTMVAGIASSLTLSGMGETVVSSADQFQNKRIAVLKDSPSVEFVSDYNGKVVLIEKLEEGYKLLKDNEVEAVVFDRPQIKYFLEKNPDEYVRISESEYLRQGYGFAFPLNSKFTSKLNIDLLKFKEEGLLRDIVNDWLGVDKVK